MMDAGHALSCTCGEVFATIEAFRDHLDTQTPETLYVLVDPSMPEGWSLAGNCEQLFGVLYLVEEFEADACCEHCGKAGAYRIDGDPHGPALCRHHVEQQPWIAAVVEEEEQVKQFKMPNGPVRKGEHQ